MQSATLQAVLPIVETPAIFRRPVALPRRKQTESSGTHYIPYDVRSILRKRHAGASWTINPYRGCELGCTYCSARESHRFFGLAHWRDFEREIFVKQGGAEALERKLRRAALAGQPIVIGTATDPYQPAELEHGVTRSLLETFRKVAGLHITIATKSPHVLRDLELLEELDRKHAISVHMTVTTHDEELAHQMEPGAPSPAERMKVLAELAHAGLTTKLLVNPLMPHINHREHQLRPLFEAAREAGVVDVLGDPLVLHSGTRSRFLPWLEETLPELPPLYQRLYARGSVLPARERARVVAPFHRLHLEHGFPRVVPGRG